VGYLADAKRTRPSRYAVACKHLEDLNRRLEAHSLPLHAEPEDIPPWYAQMWDTSGLHYLRRLAAYVDLGLSFPKPGDANSADDALLRRYYQRVFERQSTGRAALSFRFEFNHLIAHRSHDGLCLPRDCPFILPAATETPIGVIGSVPRLLAECERLARVLEIPAHLTPGSPELWDAAALPGRGSALWQLYGAESLSCVVLQAGCKRSLQTGAALFFS
jgi:hypothetical protein